MKTIAKKRHVQNHPPMLRFTLGESAGTIDTRPQQSLKYGTPEYWEMIEDKHWAESATSTVTIQTDGGCGTSIERLQ